MVQATGIVVIRRRNTSKGYLVYYKYVDSVPYKSKEERIKVMRRLCVKYGVNNFNVVVSVIPDEIKIDVDSTVGMI